MYIYAYNITFEILMDIQFCIYFSVNIPLYEFPMIEIIFNNYLNAQHIGTQIQQLLNHLHIYLLLLSY